MYFQESPLIVHPKMEEIKERQQEAIIDESGAPEQKAEKRCKQHCLVTQEEHRNTV